MFDEKTNEIETKKEPTENTDKIYKGVHINFKIIKLLGCVAIVFIAYNLLKSNPQKEEKNIPTETGELTEKNLDLNTNYSNLKTDYSNVEISDVDIKSNSDKKSDFEVTNSNENFKNEEEIERIRKLKEEAENAKRSTIGFQTMKQQEQYVNNETKTNNQDYDQNRQGSKKNFLNNEVSNNFYLTSQLTQKISNYEIKAGGFMPAVLITGLNSDLPSKVITAQIRENIYDTVTGNYLLIPQGTRVIGMYDSNVTWGQNRLLVIWQRMIFPNGASIALDNMQGIDLSGQAGVTGKVNNHFGTLLKGVLLSSVMGATAAIVTNKNDNDNNWQGEAGKGAGETIIQIGDKFAQKALERQPTIIINPGERFNIIIHSDMILKPYIKYKR